MGEQRKKRFLLVFGHGRRVGLGCELRDFICQTWVSADLSYRVHNLLEDGFDPVLRLAEDEAVASAPVESDDPLAYRYAQDVQWTDSIVFLHPVWWFSMPAILKGWVDRIFVEGIAITQGDGGAPVGLLAQKEALLIQTFGSNSLIEKTVFRGLSQKCWRKAIFLPTGLKTIACMSLHGTNELDPATLDDFKIDLRKTLLALAET